VRIGPHFVTRLRLSAEGQIPWAVVCRPRPYRWRRRCRRRSWLRDAVGTLPSQGDRRARAFGVAGQCANDARLRCSLSESAPCRRRTIVVEHAQTKTKKQPPIGRSRSKAIKV
jgi:hypothetical protein